MAEQREVVKARWDALRLRQSYLEEIRVGLRALASETYRKNYRLRQTKRKWRRDLEDRKKELRDREVAVERDERILTGSLSLDEKLNKHTIELDLHECHD